MHRVPLRTAIGKIARLNKPRVVRAYSDVPNNTPLNVEKEDVPKKPWVLLASLASAAALAAYYVNEQYGKQAKKQTFTKTEVPATAQELRNVTEDVIPVLPRVKDSLTQVEHADHPVEEKKEPVYAHHKTFQELKKEKHSHDAEPEKLETTVQEAVNDTTQQVHQEEAKEAIAMDNAVHAKPTGTVEETEQSKTVPNENTEPTIVNEITPPQETTTTPENQNHSSPVNDQNQTKKEESTPQSQDDGSIKYYQDQILDGLENKSQQISAASLASDAKFIQSSIDHLNDLTKEQQDANQQLRSEQEERASSQSNQESSSENQEQEQLTYLTRYNEQVRVNDDLKSQVERLSGLLIHRENELIKERQDANAHLNDLTNQAQFYLETQRVEFINAQQQVINDARELLANVSSKYDQLTKQQEEELKITLANRETEITRQFQKESLKRIERLSQMTSKVYATEYVLNASARYLNDSLQVQQLTVAGVALQYACNTSGPINIELDAIKSFSGQDELMSAIVQSVPQAIAKRGAPLVDDLTDRFINVVKHRALIASLQPKGWGLPGYLYGVVASNFVIEEKGLVDGTHLHARLARAEHYLKNKRLAQGIEELEKASQTNQDFAFVVNDWLTDAKSRLIVDQALEAIQHHIVNLNISINH
ncbi:hypothetical protein AKO1_007371 [Acrasis kona]|uniref:MICOS complex subunit MIC60 n=1 Tax=Acrasis kona TaxID=1008807 RepID=A0AAW2YTE2_9EUKA